MEADRDDVPWKTFAPGHVTQPRGCRVNFGVVTRKRVSRVMDD